VTDCSLLGWLSLLVLALTGAVIAWYTVETYRLRREAQLQTELQHRPFLSIEFDRGRPAHLRAEPDTFVRITNIGHGLARNIFPGNVAITLPRESADSWELRGHPVPHLAPGESVEGPWHLWIRLTPEDPPGAVSDAENARQVGAAIVGSPIAVVISLSYSSIVGQRYRTTIHVEGGRAQIVNDERL
jgi:hypothetical protein